uniref:Protein FAM38A n=1 Tax=Apis cerana TaxID=7461 RepID=V9IDA6_APICE
MIPDTESEKREAEKRRELEQRGRRMTISELMNTLIKTDIEIATHVAMYGGTEKDALKLRRRSEPLTRKKSSMSYLSARSETAVATDAADVTSADVETEEKDEEEREKTEVTDVEEEKKHEEEIPKEERISIATYFNFLIAIINSTFISMTRYLNRFSRDYRYIRKVLTKEKKLLKAKPDLQMGMRLGMNQMWQPMNFLKKDTLFSEISPVQHDDDRGELSEADQPPIIQLLASIWFAILSHSSLFCYFMVFLHQIKNASVLSIPLPLMVFFWGSLTIPRPSKTFWITLIAYTEAIVIVKVHLSIGSIALESRSCTE